MPYSDPIAAKRHRKAYYEKNKDKFRRKHREWTAAHKERISLWGKRRYHSNPENEFDRRLRRRYGISLKDYNNVLFSQNGVCALCHKQQTRMLTVDHDHKSGDIGGLLCYSCNLGLGLFRDHPEHLIEAAQYLNKPAAWSIHKLDCSR